MRKVFKPTYTEVIHHNTPQNPNLCCKELIFQPGGGTSIHWHPIKQEYMFCSSGCAMIHFAGYSNFLEVGSDGVFIEQGVAHQIQAGGSGAIIVEASTYDSPDDVVRQTEF